MINEEILPPPIHFLAGSIPFVVDDSVLKNTTTAPDFEVRLCA